MKHPGTREARIILKQYGRDLTQCERCGAVGPEIHVHHKDQNPYNNKIENLIILCSRCHSSIHGYLYRNPDLVVEDNFDVIDEEKEIPTVPEMDKSTLTIKIPVDELNPSQSNPDERITSNQTIKLRRIEQPKHFDSIFKGYQCRQCLYFLAFKDRCEISHGSFRGTNKACKSFVERGHPV